MGRVRYLDTPEKWKKLAGWLIEHSESCGLDSEFEGVDFRKGDSCPDRARIHVWSLAVYNDKYHPRGYREATGYTLPRAAIPYFKEYLENDSYTKFAHNSGVDVHSFYNHGVDVLGVVNTLSLARWVLPTRLVQSLDSLGTDCLGKGKIISFKEMVTEPAYVEKLVQVKYCDCGIAGCRKRKGHSKLFREETELVERGTREIPLSSIIPGHERWELLVEYAGQDAIIAAEFADYVIRLAKRKDIEVPWL